MSDQENGNEDEGHGTFFDDDDENYDTRLVPAQQPQRHVETICEEQQKFLLIRAFIQARKSQNIDIPQMEKQLGFEWQSFLNQTGTSAYSIEFCDPYCSELVLHSMLKSYEEFIQNLPLQLVAVREGLHPSQQFYYVQTSMNYLRRLFMSDVVPVLAGKKKGENGSDAAMLKSVFEEYAAEIGEDAVESFKEVLQQQENALRGLLKIHTLVSNANSFTHILFSGMEDFNALALYVPSCVVKYFSKRGVCIEELLEYLIKGNRIGARGYMHLEPNGCTKEFGIESWMRRNGMHLVHPDFTAILDLFRNAISTPTDSELWVDIDVASTPIRVPCIEISCASHCYAPSPVFVYSKQRSDEYTLECGLMAHRILFILRTFINSGVFSVRRVRCELMQAALYRWDASIGLKITMDSESVEQTGSTSASTGAATSTALVSCDASSHPPPRPMIVLSHQSIQIPASLERDHAILEHILFLLTTNKNRLCELEDSNVLIIPIKLISERVVLHSSHLNPQSTHVACQWTTTVLQKLASRFPQTFEFYKRRSQWSYAPLAKPTGSCMILVKPQVKPLSDNVRDLIEKMRGESKFADEWHVSRQAKHLSKKRTFEYRQARAGSEHTV
jgi:hypothetical protein